jgi:hypothetical protein
LSRFTVGTRAGKFRVYDNDRKRFVGPEFRTIPHAMAEAQRRNTRPEHRPVSDLLGAPESALTPRERADVARYLARHGVRDRAATVGMARVAAAARTPSGRKSRARWAETARETLRAIG